MQYDSNLEADRASILAKKYGAAAFGAQEKEKNELSAITEGISGVLDARLAGHVGGHSQRETAYGRFSNGKLKDCPFLRLQTGLMQ